jgi:3-keto steroid reductase
VFYRYFVNYHSKPYFSSSHLVVVDDDDSNTQLDRPALTVFCSTFRGPVHYYDSKSMLNCWQHAVSRFSSSTHKSSQSAAAGNPPKIYLAHPGICSISFLPLPFILFYCMTLGFYIARWIGSPWHTVELYLGACAPVWLALAPQDELDMMEGHDRQRKAKWGSSTDRRGRERVRRTEVEGYTSVRDGNGDGSEKEEISPEFEELGRTCWMQMEALREEWEKRLGFSGHD